MKNEKGFTLVELLVVIAILAIVAVIAVPSAMGVNQLIKNNMLEKKKEIIEQAAVLLGQDVKGSIIASNLDYKGQYSCKEFIVSDLVPNYLDKTKVIIYYKNKRIHAVVDLKDELSCS